MFENILSWATHRTRIHHANSIKLITLNVVHFFPQAVYFLSGKTEPVFIKHAIIWSVFISSLNKGLQRRERSFSIKPNFLLPTQKHLRISKNFTRHLIRPTNKLSVLIGSLIATLWNCFFIYVLFLHHLLQNKRKEDVCVYYWVIKLSHLWSSIL